MDYPGLARFVSEMEARYVERADELLQQLYMRFKLELQVFCKHFKMGFHMASVAVASSFDVELPDAGLAHDRSLIVSILFWGASSGTESTINSVDIQKAIATVAEYARLGLGSIADKCPPARVGWGGDLPTLSLHPRTPMLQLRCMWSF